MKKIEVVLKVSERCNINCDYCYMFNLGNDDYKENPKFISINTIKNVYQSLKDSIKKLNLDQLDIILHGGEPLLMGKPRFIEMCEQIIATLSHKVKLKIRMQTNAILVNQSWIDIFSKYKISIGVSIDGPEEYNDIHRVDHKGNGTYKKTLRGIKNLQSAAHRQEISEPGLLIVIDPNVSGKKIYQHVVEDLLFTNINFLLPMLTHETSAKNINKSLTNYLDEILLYHIGRGHRQAKVRILNQFASFLKSSSIKSRGDNFHYVIGISSSGQFDVDDEFKTIENKYSKYNIENSSIYEFVNSEYFLKFESLKTSLPNDCQGCCWKNYCVGGSGTGSTLSRYSTENEFNNKSVYCDSLKSFFSFLTTIMLKSGLDKSLLEEKLSNNKRLTILPPHSPKIRIKQIA